MPCIHLKRIRSMNSVRTKQMSCSLISCMSLSVIRSYMVHKSKVSFDLAAFFREAKFLVNVAQLANEGIIISWGKTSERPARLENRSNDATERNLLARNCMISLFLVIIDIQRMCVCNDLSLTTVTSNTSTTSPRWSPWDSRETKTSKRSCGSSQACRAWGRSAWCLNSLNRVKTS